MYQYISVSVSVSVDFFCRSGEESKDAASTRYIRFIQSPILCILTYSTYFTY